MRLYGDRHAVCAEEQSGSKLPHSKRFAPTNAHTASAAVRQKPVASAAGSNGAIWGQTRCLCIRQSGSKLPHSKRFAPTNAHTASAAVREKPLASAARSNGAIWGQTRCLWRDQRACARQFRQQLGDVVGSSRTVLVIIGSWSAGRRSTRGRCGPECKGDRRRRRDRPKLFPSDSFSLAGREEQTGP